MRALLLTLGLIVSPAPALAVEWLHWPVTRAESAQRYVTQGFYGDYISYCCTAGNNCRDIGGTACGTHNGYDYGIPSGTPLFAAAPGVVDAVHATDTAGDYGNAGLYVRIRHDAGQVSALGAEVYFTAYLHMSRIDVAVGAVVDTQTQIGLSGASGGVAAHLHLHVHTAAASRYCGGAVDPGCPTQPHVQGSVIPGFAGAPGCQSHCEPGTNMWLQPAAYGGEPYGGCQGLDYLGRCAGAVLEWCENGSPMAVDCSADGRVCSYQDDSVGYNCVACDALGLPACSPDDLTHTRCEAGVAVTAECFFGCDDAAGCAPEPAPMDSPDSAADLGTMDANVPTMPSMTGDAGPGGDLGHSGEPRLIETKGGCSTSRTHGTFWAALLLVALTLVTRRRRY